MFLMIDNYDSFVYNLVAYFKEEDEEILVKRNDAITVDTIKELSPRGIILSPGPKKPEDAGICLEIIRELGSSIPIFGVCLGHQVIGTAFGGKAKKGKRPVHGKVTEIQNNNQRLFQGLPEKFEVTRYHSLVVDSETLPQSLLVDATYNNVIMGLSHKEYPIYGLQFHPEAVLTQWGHELIKNFILLTNEWWEKYDANNQAG